MVASTEISAAPVRAALADQHILLDADANRRLNLEGVVTTPFLEPAEVDALLAAYAELAPEGDHGLTVDYMRPDRDHVRRVMDTIEEHIGPAVARTFDSHRIVMSTFVVKHPGEASQMFLHDDRSYVDERKFRAATMWIPLVDIGPTIPNGALSVVPRSHLLPTGWSGSHTPDAIRPYEEYLRSHLEPVEARAGDAVIYDTRVLHASAANETDSPRIAVAVAMAPDDAELLHVVATGRRGRDLHRVDGTFFRDHHPREIEVRMPEDCPVFEHTEDLSDLRADEIVDALGTPGAPDARPAVPEDVRQRVAAPLRGLRLSEPAPGFVPRTADLHLDRDGFAHEPAPDGRAVAVVGSDDDGAWSAPLRRRGETRSDALGARDGLDAASPDADVIVLAPGSRAEITTRTSPRWHVELTVVECPTVGAGCTVEGAVANARLGSRWISHTDEQIGWWNDGPGQLVVLAARIPSGSKNPLLRVRGLLARLANRRRPTS